MQSYMEIGDNSRAGNFLKMATGHLAMVALRTLSKQCRDDRCGRSTEAIVVENVRIAGRPILIQLCRSGTLARGILL